MLVQQIASQVTVLRRSICYVDLLIYINSPNNMKIVASQQDKDLALSGAAMPHAVINPDCLLSVLVAA